MRIRKSIYYTAMLTLFTTGPVLAAESISQIQSLQGQAWVQRGDKNIELNGASDIYSGDLVSTSHTGRLGTQLWSQVSLKLGANSKIIIISEANKTKENASAAQKIIKLEYGASCVEINDLMDSPVLFQIGGRVTIKFIKPVELCLSSDEDKSEIQLIKGRAELVHLTNSMVIALNEPGSEISFFNGGIFKLVSASSAAAQVIPMGDLKAFSKIDFLNKSSSTVELKVPSKTEVPVTLPKTESSNEPSKTEELKEPSKAAGLKVPAQIAVPIVIPKTEDSKESSKVLDQKVPSKTEAPIALSKTEDSKEPSKVMDQKTPSKITVPIALSETEDLKESSKTVDQKAPPRIAVPIALSKTDDSNEPSKTKNTEELYNVYLHTSRSYEPTAAVNRRLQESGYSSFVIDEIDNQGPIFRISVPNFESITAARGFVDKVVVGLGIHDAWIERHLKKVSKTEKQRKATFKKAEPKQVATMDVQKKIAKTEFPIALSKTQDLKEASKTPLPIALTKTEDSNKSSKTSNEQELYNVNLNSSRSYEATAAINRRLRESGYNSIVVDEIDNQGPLFRVSVPNFESITVAREFVDKVVVSLGIHGAWIERHLKESSKAVKRKASSKKEGLKKATKTVQQKKPTKTQTPVALSKTKGLKESSSAMELTAPSKAAAPIALTKKEDSNQPSKTEEPSESAKSKNTEELYNVNLSSSRSYEATAAVNRRLQESGYSSFIIDEIDNQGPIFRVSVPNFETLTSAREFVDKVVVSLGIHDAWIDRQRQKK